MKIFELKYKSGPHGDECCSYNIKFNKEIITVREFLNQLNPEEWGAVRLYVPNPLTWGQDNLAEHELYMEFYIEYKNGVIHNLPKTATKWVNDKIIDTSQDIGKYLDCVIDVNKGWANGGWSCMDYWIFVKNSKVDESER